MPGLLPSLYTAALAAAIVTAQSLTDAQVWAVRQRLGDAASAR